MDRLLVLLAPFAVLLPAARPVDPSPDLSSPAVPAPEPVVALFPPPPAPSAAAEEELGPFPVSDSFRTPVENQVRIEQRITIRIAPRASAPRPFMFDLPDRAARRLSERHMGKCLPIAGIAGVQVNAGRLMVFMRDRRMVSLGLEKSCRPQDFYSGFYVERNADGQLCVDRDRLQSRSGANCALTRLRQLVEE